eukprot:355907-Chlamydomonas_euryale.AAC.5
MRWAGRPFPQPRHSRAQHRQANAFSARPHEHDMELHHEHASAGYVSSCLSGQVPAMLDLAFTLGTRQYSPHASAQDEVRKVRQGEL